MQWQIDTAWILVKCTQHLFKEEKSFVSFEMLNIHIKCSF